MLLWEWLVQAAPTHLQAGHESEFDAAGSTQNIRRNHCMMHTQQTAKLQNCKTTPYDVYGILILSFGTERYTPHCEYIREPVQSRRVLGDER